MKGERTTEPEYSRMTIPFGPVHPALKEPVHLAVAVRREEVVDVDIRLGHVHRAVEALAETRNLVQNIHLTEKVCGICSHCHPTCFTQAIEEIGDIQVPERAVFLRTLIAELERIHSHLLWMGVLAYEMGFDTLFMYCWRIREGIMDLNEMITGNRIAKAMNTIGGVRWNLNVPTERIRRVLKDVEQSTQYINRVLEDKTAKKRLLGIGVLSRDDAIRLCTVGPVARGSGIKTDVRKDDPYAAYGELRDSFSVIVRSSGDVLSRAEVRILETLESVHMIDALLERLPDGPISQSGNVLALMRKIPRGEAISRVEAPRGELFHYVRTNGNSGVERLKIRAPSLANLASLKPMLVGNEIADIPLVVASIDPCISCAERVTVVNTETNKTHIVDVAHLRRSKKQNGQP